MRMHGNDVAVLWLCEQVEMTYPCYRFICEHTEIKMPAIYHPHFCVMYLYAR